MNQVFNIAQPQISRLKIIRLFFRYLLNNRETSFLIGQFPEQNLMHVLEFIDVGKKQRALDALYDVIKSKRHRTWQKIHEPIMEKYLDLCVELKKSHIAKEGLYQYKNICQQVRSQQTSKMAFVTGSQSINQSIRTI